ncbi:MAG: hydroxyisourate hydrolase [Gemmatimonadota bacterium]
MISTHVLDLMSGKPASGVTVVLGRLDADGWTIVGKARTNRDGRVKSVNAKRLSAGIYELSFETGAYFKKKKVKAFHPWVTITVHIKDAGAHHHVPLLLSPFGYSTYRGS